MQRLAVHGITPREVVVIGDTEHDAAAAHAVGATAVLVATGWTSLTELQVCGAALTLPNLGTAAAPLHALLGLEGNL
jgi:phosphoglycolate phosphatase-like HAD superfamily hydrolase